MYFHFQNIDRLERIIYFKQLKLVREIQELTTFSEELQQSILRSKVWSFLCELTGHEALEVLTVLTDEITSSALGEGPHTQSGHSPA